MECEKVVKSSRLYGNEHFETGKMVFPTIGAGGHQKILKIQFSYAYGNGTVKWLGQRVALKRYPGPLMKEVKSVIYNFERVIDNAFITQDNAATVVCPMDDQIGDPNVIEAIDTLRVYTNVINLREPEMAKNEFDKVAAIPLGHN